MLYPRPAALVSRPSFSSGIQADYTQTAGDVGHIPLCTGDNWGQPLDMLPHTSGQQACSQSQPCNGPVHSNIIRVAVRTAEPHRALYMFCWGRLIIYRALPLIFNMIFDY